MQACKKNEDTPAFDKSKFTDKNWIITAESGKDASGKMYEDLWSGEAEYLKDDVSTWRSDGTYSIEDGANQRPNSTGSIDKGTWSEANNTITMASQYSNISNTPFVIDELTDTQMKVHLNANGMTIYYTYTKAN